MIMRKINLMGMIVLMSVALAVTACGKKGNPEYKPVKTEQPKKKSSS
jgi:predicted small lipoprotein YifL